VVCLALVGLATVSCERLPLLAPSGSTITLTASTTAMSVNGTAQLIAQVIEQAGTPPHSGTHVIFTTTLGSVKPPEGDTDINGRVLAIFDSGTANGTATITATSGGVGGAQSTSTGSSTTTSPTNVVKIAIGTAAVGRVSLTANPTTIAAVGGQATIVANVVDVNGSPLSGAAVNFATSAGSLSTAVVNTDATGTAQTVLQTPVTATVTANVGFQSSGGGGTGGGGTGGGGTGTGGSTSGQASATVTVNVSPLPVVSIAVGGSTGANGTFTAGSPISFTISVQPGANSTAQIKDVSVDFGDGTPAIDLGAVSGTSIPVQYSFRAAGNYTVRVTAIDTLNTTVSAATRVVVLPEPPLSASILSSQTTSGTTTTVTFTATVTPATATVASYSWDFGPGIPPRLTTGNQVVQTFTTGSGTRTVTLTVTTTTGQTTSTQIAITP
jgi:adhesin/invasin